MMGPDERKENLYRFDPSEIREWLFKSPPIILSGSNNYTKWHRTMTRTFNLKKKLCFVDGTIDVPPKNHRDYAAWEQCNQLVLSWILKSVSPEITSSLDKVEKAAHVWRNLKNRFSPGNQFIIIEILEEIRSLKQGDRDVGRYYKEFSVLWSDLELVRPVAICTCARKCSCGAMERMKKQMEEEKVGWFLKGLDDNRFGSIKSRIMREEPLPPLSQVSSIVFQEETTMASASLPIQPPSSSKQVTGNSHLKKVADGPAQIRDHSIHPYPLTLKSGGGSYTCSGCKELAFGPSYRCESSECTECKMNKCIFVLDEVCASAVIDSSNNKEHSSVSQRPFFKKSKFRFLKKPPGYPRICDACTKDVKGFMYHCKDTSNDLHPRCMKLNRSVYIKESDVKLELWKTIPIKAGKCQKCTKSSEYDKKGKGWSYVSSKGENWFHVSCFKELMNENHDFFKQELSKKEETN